MSQDKSLPKKVEKKSGGIIWTLISSVMWGWFVGLLINGYLGFVHGYDYVIQDLDTTYSVQVENIAWRNPDAAARLSSGLVKLGEAIEWVESKAGAFFASNDTLISLTQSKTSASTRRIVSGITEGIGRFVTVLLGTFLVLIAKFMSLFVSVWVFLFASIVGAMDGLLTRYVRTYEGGRESAFIYHKVANLVMKVPFGVMFLYLSLPVFLDPEVVVVVISLMFFWFFYVATANLKKFL